MKKMDCIGKAFACTGWRANGVWFVRFSILVRICVRISVAKIEFLYL